MIACFRKNSYWELKKLDYICAALALLALLLWRYTKQAYVAVIFSILSDLIAGIPTILKLWKHPKTESGIVYITAFFAMSTSLLAAKMWSFSEVGFPIYLMAFDVLALCVIVTRKIIARQHKK